MLTCAHETRKRATPITSIRGSMNGKFVFLCKTIAMILSGISIDNFFESLILNK